MAELNPDREFEERFQEDVDFAKWRASFILRVSVAFLIVFWFVNLYVSWMLATHQIETATAQALVYQIAITTTVTEVLAVMYAWTQGLEFKPYVDQLRTTIRWSQLFYRIATPFYEAMSEVGHKITGKRILAANERQELEMMRQELTKLKKENTKLKAKMFRHRIIKGKEGEKPRQ